MSDTTNTPAEHPHAAVMTGDFSSITAGIVADIARLENDVARAHTYLRHIEKNKPYGAITERAYWSNVYANSSKELRATRQQLIELPRAPSVEPGRWQDNLVGLLANTMEQANVPAQTLVEFVKRATGQLASRAVRQAITNRAVAIK